MTTSIDARKIGMRRGAIVTLTGEVSTFAEKWNAERASSGSRVFGHRQKSEVKLVGDYSEMDIAREAAGRPALETYGTPRKVIPKWERAHITSPGERDSELPAPGRPEGGQVHPRREGVINSSDQAKVESERDKANRASRRSTKALKRMAAVDGREHPGRGRAARYILRGRAGRGPSAKRPRRLPVGAGGPRSRNTSRCGRA